MAVVVGLGNPGEDYQETRHNAGFQVLERLVARWKAAPARAPRSLRAWRARVGEREVDLLQPLSFMNASGEALREWAPGGMDPSELLVVCDDVYLSPGVVRLRRSGGSGGHRGLESIERALGTRDFGRLRLGVGAARSASALRDHVLGAPEPAERETLEAGLAQAVEAVERWLADGMIAAMNQFNRKNPKEVSEE